MIYFDNAATTFPKPECVIKAVNDCITNYCGNPGRGSHSLSRSAATAVFDVREKVASLVNFEKMENVVFTYNATYALNLALKTTITEDCHVLCSDIEHNAVMRPLEKLKQTIGISLSCFDTDGDIEKNIIKEIRNNTKVIVSTLCSNLNGKSVPLSILSKISKEYGLKLIIDASQWIGYNEIDLKKTPCDVLCAPGHKSLFGIQGCGFAIFKESKVKKSFIEGGSGHESISPKMPRLLPEAYEAGTLSTPAIVGLGAGIDFINSATVYHLNSKIYELSKLLKKEISKLDQFILYPSYGGLIAFNHTGFSPSELSDILDENGICVRSGLHCAPSAHRKLGTLDRGCVRISLSCLNTLEDVRLFSDIIRRL